MTKKRLIAVVVVGICLSMLWVAPAQAETLTPTNESELITAINTANANSEADIIILSNDISLGTTTFTSNGTNGLPPITSDITFHGNGYALQGNGTCGAGAFRLLSVESSGTLSLYNITLEGGCAASSTFPDGMGGAIFNAGTIQTIAYATIRDNTGEFGGGGIVNRASIDTITNSTFTGNSANDSTGGGGGILNFNGTINTIRNTTFDGNTANDSPVGRSGGAIYTTGRSGVIGTIANVTMTNNSANQGGGAIENTATINSITNTLIVNNNVNNSGGNCGLGISGGTDNIAGDSSCTGFTVASLPTLTLANNGGPTETVAIPADSAADDTGGGGCLLIDQRALVRPNAATTCDVGAYELGAANFTTPTANFNAASSIVLEGTSVSIPINLEVGAVDIGDSVTVWVRDTATGTATSGTDYATFAPTSVTFTCTAASPCTGTIQQTVLLNTTSDAVSDSGETVNLELISVVGPAVSGTPMIHTVTIEETITAAISATIPTVSETSPNNGEFTVSLPTANVTGGPITVNYDVSGTATSGSDYTALSGSVQIPNGEQAVTIDVVPLDDGEFEPDETVILTLTGTDNNNIAVDDTSATVTITSEDAPPPPPGDTVADAPPSSESMSTPAPELTDVQELPTTGETPLWRDWLGLMLLVLGSTGFMLVAYRVRRE